MCKLCCPHCTLVSALERDKRDTWRERVRSFSLGARAGDSAEEMQVEPSEEAAEEMDVEPEGLEAPPATPLAASAASSTEHAQLVQRLEAQAQTRTRTLTLTRFARGRRSALTTSSAGGAAPTGAIAARLRRRSGAECYSRRRRPRAESRSSTARHHRRAWCHLRHLRIAPLL